MSPLRGFAEPDLVLDDVFGENGTFAKEFEHVAPFRVPRQVHFQRLIFYNVLGSAIHLPPVEIIQENLLNFHIR